MKELDTKTIFLAEGEKHIREALHLMLEHQPNFEIAGEADTAESLLAQVCLQPPDLILLDWNLPGLHPQRLLPALRQYCPETIILATSVKPEQKKIIQEYKLDGFVSKQLPPEEFLTTIIKINSIDGDAQKRTHSKNLKSGD